MADQTAWDSDIAKKFNIFHGGTGGIDSWLEPNMPCAILDGIKGIEANPLSKARLSQLLTLAGEPPISDAFFRYYWISVPAEHPYKVRNIPCFANCWTEQSEIIHIDQLYWGMYRFYVDALLYFGNIRSAFKSLSGLSERELTDFFRQHRFDTDSLLHRGDSIGLSGITKDKRYLISEMACKSFDKAEIPESELSKTLTDLYRQHIEAGGSGVTTNQLLNREYGKGNLTHIQTQLDLSTDDFKDEVIRSEDELRSKITRVEQDFQSARQVALDNTKAYLSMVGDLDVYVATSMRTREDFRNMADFCENVFEAPGLSGFKLRYFDPTLSAAAHHEDKGLIECLMVKCAKVLILHAGTRDSYGKDSEAAMALNLGKPVIIHADEEYRSRFFRDVHPLSRLIEFDTGVAIGAMVATSASEVVELLRRIFSNDVDYKLAQPHPKYLVLKEKVTDSVVRLQTSDSFLRETFWNYYHSKR